MYINQNAEGALGDLLRDKRFRQALSLAINRQEVVEQVGYGLAKACQGTVHSSASFYKEEWAQSYVEYNPERANKMLDEIGLTKRDGDGFRLLPNGERLSLLVQIPLAQPGGVGTAELVKEYWGAVGVRVDVKAEDYVAIFRYGVNAGKYAVASWPVDMTEEVAWRIPGFWNGPKNTMRIMWTAPLWNSWYNSGGAEGVEPPADVKHILDLANSTHLMTDEELASAATEILDWWAENFFYIGIYGYSQLPCVAKKGLGNVDRDMLVIPVTVGAGKCVRAETFFWRE
jgi:peptide/nickel transport system substrate-binding protein